MTNSTAQSELTKIMEVGAETERKKLLGQLLIAKQDPNITPETDLEGFQNQGGYAPEVEGGEVYRPAPKGSGRSLERRVQDKQRMGQPASSPGTVFRAPDDSPYRNLMIEGDPSFEIDPSKKPLTERQKATQDKLRRRAGGGQQGASTAKDILEKKGGSALDIPTFLQNAAPKVQDALMIGGAILWELFKPNGALQLSELNPAQLKALEAIPSNLNKLPDADRLKIMRQITRNVKGLA